MRPGAALFIALLAAAGAARAEELPPGAALKIVADVPLPGDTSRFDYESYDAQRHLLFISHLGASEVLVFDTLASKVAGRIPNLSQVHGVLVIPELGRIYASATGTHEVAAVDEATLAVLARAPAGRYPDGMAYAPEVHTLYVSDEGGAGETAIDVRSNLRVASIPLGGEAGNTQYDPSSGHLFVNVQSSAQLAEIDPLTGRIVARDTVPGDCGNHGLLIESAQRLALIACERSGTLLVFDLQSRAIASTWPVGASPDVLAYDASLQLLYVASESGVVSLFRVGARRLDKIADLPLGARAHTVAVDPDTHRAYFALANVAGHPVLRITEPAAFLLRPPPR